MQDRRSALPIPRDHQKALRLSQGKGECCGSEQKLNCELSPDKVQHDPRRAISEGGH